MTLVLDRETTCSVYMYENPRLKGERRKDETYAHDRDRKPAYKTKQSERREEKTRTSELDQCNNAHLNTP